jgi:hypothetical protein
MFHILSLLDNGMSGLWCYETFIDIPYRLAKRFHAWTAVNWTCLHCLSVRIVCPMLTFILTLVSCQTSVIRFPCVFMTLCNLSICFRETQEKFRYFIS